MEPKNKCCYCKNDITWIRKITMNEDQKNNKHYFKCITNECYNIACIVADCEKINSEWSPEYYVMKLMEANGKIYLDSISRSTDLTPSQGVKLYESAYEDHYQSKLPSWFKTKLFDDHVKPYYKQRYYDSLLLKPKGTIDFKKYID